MATKKATAKEPKQPKTTATQATPAKQADIVEEEALVIGDRVIFIEDDLVTSHDALVQEIFVHQSALSPTGQPSVNLVYIDAETRAVVTVCDVPHVSLLDSPDQGKHWCNEWEIGDEEAA